MWAIVLASLLSGFFFVASLYIAQRRLLWYDEVMTALVSRQAWPGEVMRILKTGTDQQPLPYYLLVKLCGQPFGFSAVSLRIPSALAMLVGLVVTFDCARRLTDWLHGLMALSFLTCSALPYYGFEARPYALVVMWSACSLWLWLNTRSDSRPAALLFGLTVFGSVTAHYYAFFCLIPYAASILLDRRDKGVPLKIVAGCVGAGAGLAFLLPVVSGLRTIKANFWAPATPGALSEIFADLFPHFLIFLPLILVLIAVADVFPRKQVPAPPMSSGERLGWLFLLIPFVGFVAASLVTNAFYYRYFIGLLPGVVIGFCSLMWRNFRYQVLVPEVVTALLASAAIFLCVLHIRHPEQITPLTPRGENLKMSKLLQMEDVLLGENKQFVVLPLGNLLTMEALYHSTHPERYRVLDDPNLPIELLAPLNKRAGLYLNHPMHFWNIDDLRKHAREAALTDCSDDTLDVIQRRGIDLHFRLHDPLRVAYLDKHARLK
jgi:uncharacterized membrane protein